jgi:hypothetical protein
MFVFDDDGVAHEVYNKTECLDQHKQYGYIENWIIRTLCYSESQPPFLGLRTKIANMGLRERGDTVTCIRCASLECDHGVEFHESFAKMMSREQIRKRYPRLDGLCPKGCGYRGIAYASHAHYVYGDW